MANSALEFKPGSESYLKKLRLPVQRGDFNQPRQFSEQLPPREVVQYHPLGTPAPAPHREEIGRFDRTGGGYVGVAQRLSNNEDPRLPTFSDVTDDRPNQNIPENVQKVRPLTAVVRTRVESDLRAKARAQSAVAGPQSWKGRGELDITKRGKMIYSGWKDPETGESEIYVKPTNVPKNKQKEVWSDPAVHDFVYRSTAQRAMDDINWDAQLPPAIPPPETTVEEHSNPVSEKLRQIRNVKSAGVSEWQKLGKGWDYHQMRNQYIHQHRAYSYTSNYKTGQIPDYKGHVGGFGERDDTYSDFQPIAVKRSEVPPYYGTGRNGNIPGYTGKIYWLGILAAHNNKPETPEQTTTNTTFIRHHPKSAPPSSHRKRENLSKMITAVPPNNPFRRSEREHQTSDPLKRANTPVQNKATELYA